MPELVATLLLIGTAALAAQEWRLRAALSSLDARLRSAACLHAEAQRLADAEQQLAEAQRLAEAVVSGGTQTVRAIHHGIAAIPFGILEAIPVTRDTTRLVRASHDLISGAVYGSIQAVNRGVGAGLRAGLKKREALEPPADEDGRPPELK